MLEVRFKFIQTKGGKWAAVCKELPSLKILAETKEAALALARKASNDILQMYDLYTATELLPYNGRGYLIIGEEFERVEALRSEQRQKWEPIAVEIKKP